jgi:hypothetical protein
MAATIDNWPYGSLRTTAYFAIEYKTNKGERGVRTTVNPKNGRMSAPKTLTYAKKARIVDGSDGRTYIAELSMYGSIHIMQSNMQLSYDHVMVGDTRYTELLELFKD